LIMEKFEILVILYDLKQKHPYFFTIKSKKTAFFTAKCQKIGGVREILKNSDFCLIAV